MKEPEFGASSLSGAFCISGWRCVICNGLKKRCCKNGSGFTDVYINIGNIPFVVNDRFRAACVVDIGVSGGVCSDADLVGGIPEGVAGIVVWGTVFDG